MDIKEELGKITGNVKFSEPMKNHTTFRIGGPADIFAEPESAEEIKKLISFFRREGIEWYVIGNGSNILVPDKGIKGAIIKLGPKMANVVINGNEMTAEAGALMPRIASGALSAELSGFENMSGIPGSLGGAVYMNAGAYGSEMADIVGEVTYITPGGEIKKAYPGELGFGYRKSIFTSTDDIILSAKLIFSEGKKAEIAERMRAVSEKRNEKQPLNYPSAGSFFKRPEGYFAGKLIEDCGLKGYSSGGAKISEKHAGFVINHNNATASDIAGLMRHVQKTVSDKFGVWLMPEVKLIGAEWKDL